MKKSIVLLFSLLGSTGLFAAQVNIVTPGVGASDYLVEGQLYRTDLNEINNELLGSSAYNLRQQNFGLVNEYDIINGGEELVWLGAHETVNYDTSGGSQNSIAVDVTNVNALTLAGTVTQTGAVSLVLSAAEALQWNLVVDGSVLLNNIFVFGLTDQTITINGASLLTDSAGEFLGDIRVFRSSVPVCGYSLPTDGEGCNTDQIVGIDQSGTDDLGFLTHTNASNQDFLHDLTDAQGISLQVTNFNGSYYVDGFSVGIDSTVVPIPNTLLLFGSALMLLLGRRVNG